MAIAAASRPSITLGTQDSAARDGNGPLQVENAVAVVVTFDSAHALPACLAALARNGVAALVVDNASKDGSPELASASGATVVRNERNEGFGRAANRGLRSLGDAEFGLLLNPDIELEDGCVPALLAAARRYPDAGALAPRLVEPDGRVFWQSRSLLAPVHLNGGRRHPPTGDACAPFLSGACLLLRMEAFRAVGGFDDQIFLFYEDDDLCRRLADSGWSLVHVHDAKARHGRGRSTAPEPGRAQTARWHQAWSRRYVAAKHGVTEAAGAASGAFALAISAAKAGWAALRRDHARFERHAGSLGGALAHRAGRTALEREGLLDSSTSTIASGVGDEARRA